ncbi:ATP-dependent translocase ABCB1 [Taenia crassiceps]|uniref:ATP-dependent translocase ABCB1 n=1 Tax=Taenia crassiceps TaxID=6207 RepID=A0ABR4QQL2_9CEST
MGRLVPHTGDEESEQTKEGNEVDDIDDFAFDESEHIRFYQLFRYSDARDKIMLVTGVIFALAVGCSFPVNLVIFSKVINLLTDKSGKVNLVAMREMVGWFCLLGAVTMILAFIELFNFSFSARRQSHRIRLKLFKQMLRQDISWFDRQSLGDIITKLTANIEHIETGIGERLGRFIQNAAMFVSCYVCAFTNNWKIALVGLSAAPLIVLAFSVMGFTMSTFALKQQKAYSKANNVASEVFNAVKTVFAFIGQEKENQRYSSQLGAAAKVAFLKNVMLGFGIGMIGGSIFASAGLTFWFGVKENIANNVESGTIVSVVLSFIVGSIALGLVLPEFSYFTRATAAASGTYWIIERVPDIDKEESGLQPNDMHGSIEFRNVSFSYPMRPDVVTLKNFSMKIDAGQTIAIVGPSGSGKSTVIQLLQRFYDPTDGQVLIDGYDIRELDLKWMRRQFGVVSQEPVLFAATVKENIGMGKEGASFEEIEAAAKLADAHSFIVGMQEEYDTMIGEGGGGMSGGQKQRLAIARALLRNPRILLLDEATSALDTHSERAVQKALDRAGVGRTVIMVAHRLTTVRNADCILVVDRGVVKESGTHDELVALNGIYANMLSSQEKKKETVESDSEPEEEQEEQKGPKHPGVWKRTSRDAETESAATSTTMSAASIFPSVNKNVLGRAFMLNKPEFPVFFIGLFVSFISGAIQPLYAILYSEMFKIFAMPNKEEKLKQTVFVGSMMAVLGLARLVTQLASNTALGWAGAKLTQRTRSLLFNAILKQEPAWFDEIANQPGVLTARLATEVSSLETVTGAQLGTIMESFCLIVASIVITFMYSWQLTLVNICFLPIMVASSAIQMKNMRSVMNIREVAGSQVVQESLSAVKTVFAFGLEDYFYNKFVEKSDPGSAQRVKDGLLYGLVHATANALSYFQTAASFYVGAVLMNDGTLDVLAVFRTFSAFNFGAQGLTRVAALTPDFKKASDKIASVFATLDRKTKLDVTEGDYPSEPLSGSIAFKNVYFRYPTRKHVRVLRKFNYTVQVGNSVALVGASGCGKSTILQLVQRLYDVSPHGPGSGIFIDGRDVRTLAPNWIRQQIGIVSQEPNLFDLSIRENIAYGDNSREVSMEEVIEAAKEANVHEFVQSLPEGYETPVGARGSQLSGGQKQRIAIARALVRKPKLLLLDEATSALDNESERIVQAALDEAMAKGGRTSLVVAHRLTTVENCDVIVVLQEGQECEIGPPDGLMAAKGIYYQLHNVDAAVKPH